MMLSAQLQDIVIKLTSVAAAITLLAEMIFQIDHFTTSQWAVTCPVNLYLFILSFLHSCVGITSYFIYIF